MTVAESVSKELQSLPADQLAEVLNFVKALKQKTSTRAGQPLPSLAGLWSGIKISSQDIDDARRDMWGDYMDSQ